MINLIPLAAKKSILTEYWVRACTVGLFLVSFALLCGVFVMLPVYVLISAQASVYEVSAAEASLKVADYKTVSAALVQASQEARFIVDGSNFQSFTKYITLLRDLQGEGIEFKQLTIARGAENKISPIVISGVASDRQTLASFRDSLLGNPDVAEVDLPISNLAKDKDISFTVTVSIVNPDAV